MKTKLLCLACSTWFEDTGNLKACPGCNDTGVPASDENFVTIKITWHELRILVMWAEKFAAMEKANPTLLKVVYGIADRLYSQHLGKSPLTLAGEIADVKAAFGEHNVETRNIPGHLNLEDRCLRCGERHLFERCSDEIDKGP